MSSCGQVVASPSRQRGPQVRAPWHHGGHGAIDVVGPVASPGRASGRGGKGVYTDWLKWPLGAVLGHSCTLLHRCGQVRERRSVHRSTKMASRRHFGAFVYTVGARVASGGASGAAARLASSQGINPHKPSRSPSSCPGDLASCMRYALADLTAATAAAILCGSLTRFVSRAVFMSMPQGLRRSIASGIVWTERPPARM